MPEIELYKDYGQPTVEAFGLHWMVRTDAWHPGGPAANQKWNPSCLFKREDGSVTISTSVIGGEPYSAEIVSAESLGYGTFEASYEIVAPTKMRDLHKNVVWGIFPFDWEDPNPGYQEIDIVEDSYWSGYTDMVGKYTYYPGDENSGIHLNDRVWTRSGKGATVRMTWMPGTIRWETWESHLTEERARNTPVNEGGYYSGTLTQTVPVPRSQRVHINLWAFKGKGGWETMPPTTMHLKTFKFTPWEGSYGVQMGENGYGRVSTVKDGKEGAVTASVVTPTSDPLPQGLPTELKAGDGVYDAWTQLGDGSILMRNVQDNGDGSVTIKHMHPIPGQSGLYSREVRI